MYLLPWSVIQVVWRDYLYDDHVMLSHVSADGDQGFPGEVAVNVTIRLTDDNEIELNFTAKVKGKATPINLTTHPYFNLAGHVCFQSQMSLYDFFIFAIRNKIQLKRSASSID